MQILLDNVIDVHTLSALNTALDDSPFLQDGRDSAQGAAKRVKSNLQWCEDTIEIKGACRLIEEALLANCFFNDAALPLCFAKVMFNRYEPGMEYGAHIDEPFINGVRTDLSFTLFLSDPESYGGGELILCKPDGEESIKLANNTLILYPSSHVHRVAAVTSGVRIAAVGWVQSQVRCAAQREILFDLSCSLNSLPDSLENQAVRLRLAKAKSHLMRLWAQ